MRGTLVIVLGCVISACGPRVRTPPPPTRTEAPTPEQVRGQRQAGASPTLQTPPGPGQPAGARPEQPGGVDVMVPGQSGENLPTRKPRPRRSP